MEDNNSKNRDETGVASSELWPTNLIFMQMLSRRVINPSEEKNPSLPKVTRDVWNWNDVEEGNRKNNDLLDSDIESPYN